MKMTQKLHWSRISKKRGMVDVITIVAKSTIKAGKKEEYLNLIEELILKSREEKGCISYNLYEDIKNPNVMTFIEEWEDEDAISAHNATIHYTTIVPKLRELREGNGEVSLYRMIKWFYFSSAGGRFNIEDTRRW